MDRARFVDLFDEDKHTQCERCGKVPDCNPEALHVLGWTLDGEKIGITWVAHLVCDECNRPKGTT